MNKRLIVFVLVLLVLSLNACGSKTEEMETTTPVEVTTEPTLDTSMLEILSEEEVEAIFGEEKDETSVTEETTSDNSEQNNVKEETVNTEPTEEATKPTTAKPQPEQELTEYEKYLAMSSDEQYAFFQSFASPEDFMTWLNAAQAEYEEKHPTYEFTGEPIDLEEILELVE